MPNPNQHIINELNGFRSSTEIFYALQIDAPWGSGKTFFIREYIKNHCPSDAEDSPKNLVISLFGIKSVQEIEQQISSQLFSGGERLAGSVFSTLASGASGFFKVEKAVGGMVENSKAKILSDKLKEVRNGIIVFDDVERCSMKMVDALGYINNFIEKEKFKVVLISNEQAFTRTGATNEEKENAVLLRGFKEKLIGRTLHLKADPDGAYDAFVEKMRNRSAKNAAIYSKDFSLIVFNASKRNNLRSLRIAIESFDRLIIGINQTIRLRDEGLRDILAECIYICCELGAAVKHEHISQPTSGRLSRLMRRVGNRVQDDPTEDEKITEDIIERYSDFLNLERPTIPFPLMIDVIANGIFDKEGVEDSIRRSPLMVEPSAVPLWRRLVEVWSFEVEQLKKDTDELIDAFSKLTLTDPGELMHLAGIMIWRESFGDLIITGGQSPESFIEDYLKEIKLAGKFLDKKFNAFTSDSMAAYGYVVLNADESRDRLLVIYDMIRGALNEAAEEEYENIIAALVEAFNKETVDFSKPLDDDKSVYLRMPIFTKANPNEFADLILRDGKLNHHIIKWFAERYQSRVGAGVKASEQEWIDCLYNELTNRFSVLPPLLKGWWRQILDQNLKQFTTLPSITSSAAANTP